MWPVDLNTKTVRKLKQRKLKTESIDVGLLKRNIEWGKTINWIILNVGFTVVSNGSMMMVNTFENILKEVVVI
jgi:hypothetical protein